MIEPFARAHLDGLIALVAAEGWTEYTDDVQRTYRAVDRPGRNDAGGVGVAHREASCSCGQLRATVEGDPRRVSICHCLACQRRTGSAFGVQSRFDRDRVHITGTLRKYTRVSDEGGDQRTSHFCAECGATVYIASSSTPDMLIIPVGAFAEPGLPSPTVSVWEERMHDWVQLPAKIERMR